MLGPRVHYDAGMSSKRHRTGAKTASAGQWISAVGLLSFAILLASSCLQTWATSRSLATNFVSTATWASLVDLKPTAQVLPDAAAVNFLPLVSLVVCLAGTSWLGGAVYISRQSKVHLSVALATWGVYLAGWWCLLGLWEWAWIAAGLAGLPAIAGLLSVTPQLWLAFCVSGAITTLVCLSQSGDSSAAEAPTQIAPLLRLPRWLWFASGIYIVVFTTMNWRLYFNLLIPHGDSAMYEEHLWNLLHGKGFRSYLDQGLFLGEHIQFVHLFLIPLYLIWPSHLLLELAESTALGLGAVPVFWLIRRQTGSDRTALAASIAYLLYTPMQFLDIEIDLKTFRPEAFGIPLLLLTLDQLDRRSLRGFLIGLMFTLTVKEDYAIVFGPLGLWIAVSEFLSNTKSEDASSGRKWLIVGGVTCVGSVLYLYLATRIIMPWFRSGAEVHYARYFSKFGETPEQILQTMMTKPDLLFGELFSMATLLYAIAMLAPVAFLPCFAPGRLSVGVPLFGILCLNELAKDPRHHFHAPLVAIVFWAMADGIPRATRFVKWITLRSGMMILQPPGSSSVAIRTALWASALTTSICFSLSPVGIPFWDPGSSWYWQTLYGPSRRAGMFVQVPPQIPQTSRVASTDFVHPRFTHYERSYDYSQYRRKVSNYELGVPADTDYIVIDTQHRYSEIKRPEDIPEYRDHPDQWELVPDRTDGYFIILKRRRGTVPDSSS